jgi:hypothetical protein
MQEGGSKWKGPCSECSSGSSTRSAAARTSARRTQSSMPWWRGSGDCAMPCHAIMGCACPPHPTWRAGNGTIDVKEMRMAMEALGHHPSDEELYVMIAEVRCCTIWAEGVL